MLLLVLHKLYEKAKKHKDAVNDNSRQSKLIFNKDVKITLTGDGKSKALSTEDWLVKAEIIWCIDIIDSNCVFWAADADNNNYRKMFPDSTTCNSYQQKTDKVKYTVQFGITPYLKDIILNEPFSFGETTTSQIKKQYNGYATHHSKHFGWIVTVYLWTLFVGKCTGDDLMCHLNEILDKPKLPLVCIISLGMDGPCVNLLFKQKLERTLQEQDKVLIDVGTCPWHTAHFVNAWRYLVLISIFIFIK